MDMAVVFEWFGQIRAAEQAHDDPILFLNSAPLLPRLAAMLIERMRKRLAADRASFIEPCLPSPTDKPPSGFNWVHEIKHDGFRLMARRDPVGIRLIKWTPSERRDVGTGSRQR